jgi:hypothetical protein
MEPTWLTLAVLEPLLVIPLLSGLGWAAQVRAQAHRRLRNDGSVARATTRTRVYDWCLAAGAAAGCV